MDPATESTTLNAPLQVGTTQNARVNARKACESKTFTFDNSFWSANRNDPHYADQEEIYNALGEEFLDHNFEGYHTCIFAYVSTRSEFESLLTFTNRCEGSNWRRKVIHHDGHA
jgi:hypothetical protein